jgi:uncharacterized protein (TIGR03437 family)
MRLLDAAQGLYAATWVPASPTPKVTVRYDATAPGFEPGAVETIGAISGNDAPQIARNGVIHNLNPRIGAPLAPGTLVQIFGSRLSASESLAGVLPLPTTLRGTFVIIGGREAPLYYVSSQQVNAMAPFELEPGRPYQVIVSSGGALTSPETIQIEPVQPGVAAFADGGVIAQHADGSLVNGGAPAKPGEWLVIYLAGMGRTDVPVSSGAPSPLDPLARPMTEATVTVAGQPAKVAFAGLTPGLVALYQINFQMPDGLTIGSHELVVQQSETVSNRVIVPVR